MFTTDEFDYINIMDKAADASWLRENVIANNLANVDTPGYKRQDVAFSGILERELGKGKYAQTLAKRVRGMNTRLDDLTVESYTDAANYSYRLDKNNVDVDTENVELASEQLKYQLLTNSISSEFKRLQTVLK